MTDAISDPHGYGSILEVPGLPATLAPALIEVLGELRYKPAAAELTKRQKEPLCAEAIRALGEIDPDGQMDRLMGMISTPQGWEAVQALRFFSLPDPDGTMLAIAKDSNAHRKARCAAINALRVWGDPAVAPRLAGLLKDETEAYVEDVVTHTSNNIFDPGKTKKVRWRICDVAAAAIADLLGWKDAEGDGQASAKKPMAARLARAKKWAASLPTPTSAPAAGTPPATAPAPK